MAKNIRKMLCVLSMMTLMGGCISDKSDKAEKKEEPMEQTEIKNENKEYTLTNSDITISLTENTIYGFSGVNRYFAQYQLDGDNIKIENIGSTMMMGDEASMKKEQDFLDLLPTMNKISITDDKIILSNGNKELIFNK